MGKHRLFWRPKPFLCLFGVFFISDGKHDIKLVALDILTWESMGTAPSGTVRMVSYPGDHPTSCEHTLLTMKNDPAG